MLFARINRAYLIKIVKINVFCKMNFGFFAVLPGVMGVFFGFLGLWVSVAVAAGGVPVRLDTLRLDSQRLDSQRLDSQRLEAVEVRAYFTPRPYLRTTAAAAVLGAQSLQAQQGTTLIPALNSISGVRMEERSPGSYRLSIRGSLLRSPYGVRNVKVYLEDIPFTDAGGNTYLNILDPGSLAGVEVLKGPDGSIFGANSGGVVLLRPAGTAGGAVAPGISSRTGVPPAGGISPGLHLKVQGGSYGLLHQQAGFIAAPSTRYEMSWNQWFARSDGYREQSALRKFGLQTRHRWQYLPGRANELRLLAVYGDLNYRTPGGLTAEQFEADPRAARPASATQPGAVEQNAGIRNRTLVAGLTHDWPLLDGPRAQLSHRITLFGSYTDFTNPFITNFEQRLEQNTGLRTYLSFDRLLGDKNSPWSWQAQAGIEWQGGAYHIENYDNHGGRAGAQQAIDEIRAASGTTFLRSALEYGKSWLLEAALSRNSSQHRFKNNYPSAEREFQDYTLEAEWMPRLALSYQSHPGMVWRALVSRGFSPPTTAEIRPADLQVNTSLRAENGWNYETGWRFQSLNHRFLTDLSLFQYRMQDALIRGTRDNGAEFFHNAGRIRQSGLELSISTWINFGFSLPTHRSPIELHWSGSWAWSHFKFTDYRHSTLDHSNHFLTGVPRHTLSNTFRLLIHKDLDVWLLHQFTSSLPLNDANSYWADPYHILQAKIRWKIPRSPIHIFGGWDNLLNQSYSLGHDINAFGQRFYNPAPLRNFYAGLELNWDQFASDR